MNAHLRRQATDEGGFTLVELMVVTAMLTVIGGIVLNGIVSSFRATTKINNRIEALSELEIGLERVTRELRAANPLQIESSNRGTRLIATVTRGGNRVAYLFEIPDDDVTQLRQQTYTFDINGNPDPNPPTTELITELENDLLSLPLFQYLDANGEEVDCTGLSDLECTQRLITETEQVRVILARTVEDSSPVIMESVVHIRSLRYAAGVDDLGLCVDGDCTSGLG